MSAGTGIFLSGALIAIVVLYIATKDRWNWRKIILWPSGILLALATGIYVYSLIPERPKIEKSFWEIPLGASESDVLFAKGTPTTRETDGWLYQFNDSFGNWKYIYWVVFKDGKVWSIVHSSADLADWERMQGIKLGDSENMVREKFGVPSSSVSSDDGLRRIYTYKNYNLMFELTQNKVTSLGIYSPEVAPKGIEFSRDEAKK